MSIRCLLVDDEPLAMDVLDNLLSQVEDVIVVDRCENALTAFEVLGKGGIDLLFLDIRMPGMDGLELIQSLQNPPPIILVTAHREYAADGFDLDVLDYLVKPVGFPRLLKALDKYRHTYRVSGVTSSESTSIDDAHIDLHVDRRVHRLALKEIMYIESLKDYLKIHTVEGSLLVRETMQNILNRLPQNRFIRIHRSYIIPIQAVKSFDATEVEVKGRQLPIGPSYQREVLRHLEG